MPYERQIAGASEPSHLMAAIGILEPSGRPSDIARYAVTYRPFERGEPWAICSEALAKGPLDTREPGCASCCLNQLLQMQQQRGGAKRDGKRKSVTVQRLRHRSHWFPVKKLVHRLERDAWRSALALYLSMHSFEQNCFSANRCRTRPKRPLQV
jgi:hypothetical protein